MKKRILLVFLSLIILSSFANAGFLAWFTGKPIAVQESKSIFQKLQFPSFIFLRCTDTDNGKDYEVKGTISGLDSNNKRMSAIDYCYDENTLLEYYCDEDGKHVKGEYKDCPCSDGICIESTTPTTTICGNRNCESGETYDNCPFDCEAPCKSEFCNSNVSVYCGCSEYEELKSRACIQRAGPCEDCGEEVNVFDDYLDMQTIVYDCLSDYFGYSPLRVSYLVYNDPPEAMPPCEQENGCYGHEGGVGDIKYVLHHHLNGFHPFGYNHPTEPEHLMADKHETTHYFLYQMLHYIPSWFHEAIAMQTNERLYCHEQENPDGDAYLIERGENARITMSDGTLFNEEFYRRLRDGETSLAAWEKGESHLIGPLFIMGLKVDYDCEKDCVRDIVVKLREYEEEQCTISQEACGAGLYTLAVGTGIKDPIIKQKAEEVINEDITPLFNLLRLGVEPVCGDGEIQVGEQCEIDSDCRPGPISLKCERCYCVFSEESSEESETPSIQMEAKPQISFLKRILKILK